MTGVDLIAWLVVAAALVGWGWLAAMARRDRGGLLAGTLLQLAGAVLALAALERHQVLDGQAVSTVLLVLLAGAVLLLLGEVMADTGGEP